MSERLAALCDICQRRPSRWSVPVFTPSGQPSRTEHWCDPCHDAVLVKYPTEYMWPPRGVWLEISEVPR